MQCVAFGARLDECIGPSAADVFPRLLHFNPDVRVSASEALQLLIVEADNPDPEHEQPSERIPQAQDLTQSDTAESDSQLHADIQPTAGSQKQPSLCGRQHAAGSNRATLCGKQQQPVMEDAGRDLRSASKAIRDKASDATANLSASAGQDAKTAASAAAVAGAVDGQAESQSTNSCSAQVSQLEP